jgi:hypothetical protein
MGMWRSTNTPNGCEVISNKNISEVIIDPNNYMYKLSYGHLGKGTFIKRKPYDDIVWLIPNKDK